jgi:HEAT repeat protein
LEVLEVLSQLSFSEREWNLLFQELLADPEEKVRKKAILKMVEKGKGGVDLSKRLLSMLKDPSSDVRIKAVWALGQKKGAPQEVVPALIALLEDPQEEVRYQAIWALGESKRREATPYLLPLLKAPQKNIRFASALALGKLQDQEAFVTLMESLEDSDPYVRLEVAESLAQILILHPLLLEKLLLYLKGKEKLDSLDAVVHAIPLKVRIHSLTDLLDSKQGSLRIKATQLLGTLGPSAQEALWGIIPLLKDPQTQEMSIWALGELGNSQAIPALLQLQNNRKVQEEVQIALEKIQKRSF